LEFFYDRVYAELVPKLHDIRRPWILCYGGDPNYYDENRDSSVINEAFAEMAKGSTEVAWKPEALKPVDGFAIAAVAIAENKGRRGNKRVKQFCKLANVEISELMEHINRRMAQMQEDRANGVREEITFPKEEIILTPIEYRNLLLDTLSQLAAGQSRQTTILRDLLETLPRIRPIDDITLNTWAGSLIDRMVKATGHRLVYDGQDINLRANPQSGSYQARVGYDAVKTSREFLVLSLRSLLDDLLAENDAEKKSQAAS
jgi:hypothetical protein